MPKLPKPKNPFTPTVRRFLLDVFKPAPTLGKRGRDEDDDEEPQPQLPTPPTPPACVALQNEDTEEDVIVITALNVVPSAATPISSR
ncbi:hypothetical protein A0H81_01682 [Grifola frondosa]|uniref:Uncharacterized protein n=1 Tax=Grifola frondosa TaxID=5627 RepID=A0A1C7MPG9_GRIFR|nr:hypothetical protein A0H81_01682 [Grifola frondosa]